MLRSELHALKSCQISFINFSVGLTGAILALLHHEKQGLQSNFGLASLFPLLILLPCFWIFFDKAKTITRIVGYTRILESLLLRRTADLNFIGWENALEEFRNLPSDPPPPINWQRICKAFLLMQTRNLYWVLAFYTFSALCLVCVGIFWAHNRAGDMTRTLFGVAVTAIVGFSIVKMFNLVRHLYWGTFSYASQTQRWLRVLGNPERTRP